MTTKKKTKAAKKAPKKLTECRCEDLEKELRAFKVTVAEGFEFGANELRPLFGQGSLALVMEAIAKGIREDLEDE